MEYLLETYNEKMQKVYELARRVAKSSSNVLILGESGTGKEVLAKYIHFCSGRKGPFIPVNCAAIPEELLEAELFGFEKGAFTGAIKSKPGKFEIAHKGTLFLDEVGELSPKLQAKILRAIQEKQVERLGGEAPFQVDVRILSATNKNLEKEVKEGRFREDLYYRLNVIPIEIPPLRERREDLKLLTHFFLKKICEREGIEEKVISPEVWEILLNYPWPGNIRELQNLVERLVILTDEREITLKDLPFSLLEGKKSNQKAEKFYFSSFPFKEFDEEGVDLNQILKEIEVYYLKRALELSQGVKSKAAKLLKLNRTTFIERLKKYGLA